MITSSTAGLNALCPRYSVRSHGLAGYQAAKHGVVGLMRYYASSLAEKNIRVNTVHPTGVATPMLMNDYVERYFGEHPEALPALQNLLPVELIDAADISEAMIYLCGRSGRYITGISLPVDAGLASGNRSSRPGRSGAALLALRRVVDDGLGIAVVIKLGHPAAHILALWVELFALRRRVEHPEVRRGIGAAARRPLPAVLVVGHVAVDELLEKPPRAPLPRQVQILDQKRRDDHPHPVVHESRLGELAHSCVDDWEARPPGLPRLEQRSILVDLDRVEVAVPVPPCAVGPFISTAA